MEGDQRGAKDKRSLQRITYQEGQSPQVQAGPHKGIFYKRDIIIWHGERQVAGSVEEIEQNDQHT